MIIELAASRHSLAERCLVIRTVWAPHLETLSDLPSWQWEHRYPVKSGRWTATHCLANTIRQQMKCSVCASSIIYYFRSEVDKDRLWQGRLSSAISFEMIINVFFFIIFLRWRLRLLAWTYVDLGLATNRESSCWESLNLRCSLQDSLRFQENHFYLAEEDTHVHDDISQFDDLVGSNFFNLSQHISPNSFGEFDLY